jgi:hypothetical protein
MKTKTYLQLALLIPFMVWVICFVIFVIWSKLAPNGSGFNGSEGPVMIVMLPLLFYVFGIIGWLIPYVVLAVILFIWSFSGKAQTLMKGFALSPLIMAIFVLILVNVLSIGSTDVNQFLANPTSNAADFLGSNAWYGVLTLVWGYICVGIGYAIYKILQRRGVIKEEEVIASMPLHETS